MDQAGESDQNQYSSSKFEEENDMYQQDMADDMAIDINGQQMDAVAYMMDDMEAINEEDEDMTGC